MHRFGYLVSLVNLYKGWRKLGIKVGIRLEHSYWECLYLQADDGGPNSQADYDLRIDSLSVSSAICTHHFRHCECDIHS